LILGNIPSHRKPKCIGTICQKTLHRAKLGAVGAVGAVGAERFVEKLKRRNIRNVRNVKPGNI
jgi:hypothetical protein